MSVEALAVEQGPIYLSPDGVDITRLVRLHRRNHHVLAIRARRLIGQPNRRPDSTDHTFGQAWRAADAKVQHELDQERPYRGSREEAQHRRNRRWSRKA